MIPVDIHRLPRWLLDLLHIDAERIPENAAAWISLERFPESGWGLLAVVAVLAGFAAIAWIYRREASLSPARKAVFASLRCGVLLAMAIAIFQPALEVSVEREQEAVTLVLIDDSLSFGMQDAYPSDPGLRGRVAAAAGAPAADLGAMTRAEIARRLLADPGARFLGRLAEKNRLRIYAFSDRLRPLSAPEEKEERKEEAKGEEAKKEIAPPDFPPRGPVTDIGGAIRAAVEGQGNTPVAAVVLITDGKATAGEDPAGVGRFLAERKIPVHSIGIGDPSPTRNLRVMAVFAPERAFIGDPIAVDVRIDHRGFQGETATVELLRAEGEEPLGKAEVPLGDSAEATARFEIALKQPGRHRLIARIPPREGETFDTDNDRSALVEVVEQATRVLFISGGPSNEFRMLKNLLRRDRRVQLAAWLMSADPDFPQEGNIVLAKLPATPKELFEYDVAILHDIDPEGLPPGYAELLERFVGKHRGGLAYIAGEKYTARFFRSPAMDPVRSLLPVEPDTPALEEEFERGNFYQKEWPVVPTIDALSHAATRLSSQPDRNRERWGELPGIYWSLPARRAKPGATVLLAHSDPRLATGGAPRPLIAYQFYEGGRSLFSGIDETWRWRAVSESVYDQFWMQLVRSLAEGRLLGDRRQMILTDRDSYDLGDPMRISALVQDEEYRPSAAPSIDVEIAAEDGAAVTVTLEKDPAQAGWFRGLHLPIALGLHRIRIAGQDSPAGGGEKTVAVEIPELEFQDPRLDPATLGDLAALTGGSAPAIEEFAAIPDRIPDRRRRVVVADEPRPLWDNSILLGVVVGLLTIEWILRKWSRLP